MVGFATIGVISGIVIGIGGIRHAGDLHRAAVGGIGVVLVAAHLGDEGLPPAPLGDHGKTFVVIGVGSFFSVIFPGYTINLITRFINCFRQRHVSIINVKMLCCRLICRSSDRVITCYGMYGRKY